MCPQAKELLRAGREAQADPAFLDLGRNMTLPTPWAHAADLQNRGTTDFCPLKGTYFVTSWFLGNVYGKNNDFPFLAYLWWSWLAWALELASSHRTSESGDRTGFPKMSDSGLHQRFRGDAVWTGSGQVCKRDPLPHRLAWVTLSKSFCSPLTTQCHLHLPLRELLNLLPLESPHQWKLTYLWKSRPTQCCVFPSFMTHQDGLK